MTRPSRTPVADYPGTSRRYGDKCITCHRNATAPKPAPRPDIANTLAGLNSFLRRRRDRENAVIRRMVYTITYPHLFKESA